MREEVREFWLLGWLHRTRQDVAYALRTLKRTPGFTAVAVLTLALGIGATTAIFSIVDAVLLHPLPYPQAGRLVAVWEKMTRNPGAPPVFDSYRDFQIWQRGSRSFEQLAPATWATGGRIFTGSGPARNVLAEPVGIEFFSLLGGHAEFGRTFQPDDLNRGCTVVLSHDFWSQTFGADRNITGRSVALDEDACTITGVMPASFRFYPDAASMWMLITPASAFGRNPEQANTGVFGRLRPGVSLASAQKELNALREDALRKQGSKDPAGAERTVAVYPLAEQFAYLSGPELRLSVMILFGAVSFVLLIACVNIAGLLLGRSLIRQRELAVRMALGSGRARLARQLLTETLLLSLAGALAGTLLAAGAVHYFRVLNPIRMPPGNPVSLNPVVMGFAAAVAVLTALVSGLFPALRASQVDPIGALKAGGRTATAGPGTGVFSRALAAAQITLSISLLAGAGLLIESVNRLGSVPLGFRTDHAFTVPIGLPKWSYAKASQRSRFYREALERVERLPGVASAAFAAALPLNSGRFGANTLAVEGRPEPGPDSLPDVAEVPVSAGYFQLMGVRVKTGRLFDSRDEDTSPAVAIVNEALVRKYFPGGNAIGSRIRVVKAGNDGRWLEIVAIAGNERDKNFFREMDWEEIPLVYVPLRQQPPQTATLILRMAGGERQLGAAIQHQMSELDRSVPIGEVETMEERLARVLAYPRFRAVLLGGFAGLALLLAGVGLYGVLAQSAAQRTQEFGVRIALGADRRDVLKLVIRQGMLLTSAGLAAGLVIASGLTRLLGSLLYGVRASDPWIWFTVSLLLLLVALLATCVPAWRAASVDPMTALRNE